MEDGLYMGRAEQRCLEEVKLRYDKNEIRYYRISIEEQQQLHVLIDTAQDTDGETTNIFVHPIQGIMIHHGFHIGPNSNLPDCF